MAKIIRFPNADRDVPTLLAEIAEKNPADIVIVYGSETGGWAIEWSSKITTAQLCFAAVAMLQTAQEEVNS